MTSLFISQAEWAEALGVSRWTFRRWRAEGRIPIPVDLPGHPRWERKVADRVTRELLTTGQGRYFRSSQSRRSQRAFQPHTTKFQHTKRAQHGALVSEQAVGDVHAAKVDEGADTTHYKKVSGAFR